jgi:hypothetical protein
MFYAWLTCLEGRRHEQTKKSEHVFGSAMKLNLVRDVAIRLPGFRIDFIAVDHKYNLKYEDDILVRTDRLASGNFITLADLCNRRQRGSCRWISENDKYKQWLQGTFRSLYCLGPGMHLPELGSGGSSKELISLDSWRREDFPLVCFCHHFFK